MDCLLSRSIAVAFRGSIVSLFLYDTVLRDTGITIHVELSPTVRYALESDLGLPQLTPPICLYPQRPVWRLDSLRAISRASGYDAPCAVVPARHYSQQRAQSTMHTSGILCLIDKCAASIRYLLQGRRRSPNYRVRTNPWAVGRAALSLSLSLSLSLIPDRVPLALCLSPAPQLCSSAAAQPIE